MFFAIESRALPAPWEMVRLFRRRGALLEFMRDVNDDEHASMREVSFDEAAAAAAVCGCLDERDRPCDVLTGLPVNEGGAR